MAGRDQETQRVSPDRSCGFHKSRDHEKHREASACPGGLGAPAVGGAGAGRAFEARPHNLLM